MSKQWLVIAAFGCLWSLLGIGQAGAADHDTAPNPSRSGDSHLVAWWRFDETTGVTAVDSSGGQHAGTLEGGLSFDQNSAPGRLGRALKLNEKGQIVRVTGFKGITGTQARTVAAWIRTSRPAGELISWGKDDHGAMWIFGFIRGGLGVTPKGGYLYMKDNVQDNAWHHVAVVVRQASPPNLHDHVQLFRDGEPAVIDDIGLLDLWPIETGDALDVVIGRGFQGFLDDLRIYDRALTEDEITALARAGAPVGSASIQEKGTGQ